MGSDLRLIDTDGNERSHWSLTGERPVLEAYLDVPVVESQYKKIMEIK